MILHKTPPPATPPPPHLHPVDPPHIHAGQNHRHPPHHRRSSPPQHHPPARLRIRARAPSEIRPYPTASMPAASAAPSHIRCAHLHPTGTSPPQSPSPSTSSPAAAPHPASRTDEAIKSPTPAASDTRSPVRTITFLPPANLATQLRRSSSPSTRSRKKSPSAPGTCSPQSPSTPLQTCASAPPPPSVPPRTPRGAGSLRTHLSPPESPPSLRAPLFLARPPASAHSRTTGSPPATCLPHPPDTRVSPSATNPLSEIPDITCTRGARHPNPQPLHQHPPDLPLLALVTPAHSTASVALSTHAWRARAHKHSPSPPPTPSPRTRTFLIAISWFAFCASSSISTQFVNRASTHPATGNPATIQRPAYLNTVLRLRVWSARIFDCTLPVGPVPLLRDNNLCLPLLSGSSSPFLILVVVALPPRWIDIHISILLNRPRLAQIAQQRLLVPAPLLTRPRQLAQRHHRNLHLLRQRFQSARDRRDFLRPVLKLLLIRSADPSSAADNRSTIKSGRPSCARYVLRRISATGVIPGVSSIKV